tara:strand:+ start:51 stop:776 length:726 start_codon:yes stop_codon:yes gene_type:complete
MKAFFTLVFLVSFYSCKKNGEYIEYYESGMPHYIENYKDDEYHGVVIGYYDNGTKQKEGHFNNGHKHGKWTDYFINGEIKEISHYNNGKLNGEFSSFFKNGKIEVKGNFKNGERDGAWARFYDNGQIRKENIFINDEPNGNFTYYYENGEIEKIELYRFGKFIQELCLASEEDFMEKVYKDVDVLNAALINETIEVAYNELNCRYNIRARIVDKGIFHTVTNLNWTYEYKKNMWKKVKYLY